jgi:hypothetical protein
MTRPLDPSEEYILAAFLAGELPEHLRREIISYLAGHDQARDLLAMAQDAMDAAQTGDGSSKVSVPEMKLATSGGRKWKQVGPFSEKHHWKVTTFFAGSVLILTLIVAMMALNTSRLRDAVVGHQWAPVVSGQDVALEWEQVPGASSYHIMRFSGQEAAIIGRTNEPRIDMADLDLESGNGSEPLWVLAFGSEGQFLDRSTAVRIQPESPVSRP